MASAQIPEEASAQPPAEPNPLTDPKQVKIWRGRAKSQHTIAIKNAIESLETRPDDREGIRAHRANIVRIFDKIIARHDHLIKVWPDISSEDFERETKWYEDVLKAHRTCIENIDSALGLNGPPKSTGSVRSISSSVRSSSSQRLLQDAQRKAVESSLKLKQIDEENQLRAKEDAELKRKRLEQEKLKLDIEEEETRKNRERDRREIAKEVERDQLSATLLQLAVEDETNRDFTPLPSVGQFSVLDNPDTVVTDSVAISTSSVSVRPKSRLPSISALGNQLGQFFQRTVDAFTPRRSSSTTGLNPLRLTTISENRVLGENFVDGPAVRNKHPKDGPAVGREPSSGHIPTIDVRTATIEDTSVKRVMENTATNQSEPLQLSGDESPFYGWDTIANVPVQFSTTQSFDRPITAVNLPPRTTTPNTNRPTVILAATSAVDPPRSHPNRIPATDSLFSAQPHIGSLGSFPNTNAPAFYPPRSGDCNVFASGQMSSAYPPQPHVLHDSWIFEPDSAGSFSRNPYLKPPKINIPKFDGNPRKWPMFIQSFKIHVHNVVPDDAIRLSHLHNSLTPEIQRHIGETLVNPGLYRHALKELQRKYGNPQLVAHSCTSSILSLKPFKDGDVRALKEFSAALHDVVSTLYHSGYSSELNSSTTLIQLVAKLPPLLKGRWGEVSWSFQPQLPSLVDFDRWLDNITMSYISVSSFPVPCFSTSVPTSSQASMKSSKSKEVARTNTTNPIVFATSSNVVCSHCDGAHYIASCFKFRNLPVEQRAEVLKVKRLCYRCLGLGHVGSSCASDKKCKASGCTSSHHTLMHGAPRLFPSESNDVKPTPSSSSNNALSQPSNSVVYSGSTSVVSNRGVLLPIVPILVYYMGIFKQTFALLDYGSEVTLIKKWLAELLGMEGPRVLTTIGTANGRGSTEWRRQVQFEVVNVDRDIIFDIESALVLDTFNIPCRPINWDQLVSDWPHLKSVPLNRIDFDDIAVVIGLDHPAPLEIFDRRLDRLNPRAPQAIFTSFGWSVIGPIAQSPSSDHRVEVFHSSIIDQNLDENMDLMVRNFLQNDLFGVSPDAKPPVGTEETRALSILKDTIRHVGDRYEVGLLWKSDIPSLPNNYFAALRRFTALERRFKANPGLASTYERVINEYLDLGHASKLSKQETDVLPAGPTWFLSHHPVFNPNKPGKCRVVFDGAFQFQGVSLNSQLLKGPDFLPNLPGILIRFRQHEIALVADIEKMFHQVRVIERDKRAFCFLWRPPNSADAPAIHCMNVHIFGAICSPSICSFALRQAAVDSYEFSEQVLKEVTDHFYVDNWLVSYPSTTQAIDSAKMMYDCLLKGGFKLTQWASSSSVVRSSLSDHLLIDLDLDLDSSPVERTLGLKWDYSRDTFVLNVNVGDLSSNTKRSVLRIVSSMFDPLGFIAPIVFPAKSFLQDLWRTPLSGWDDVIEEPLLVRWRLWLDSLFSLNALSLRRSYFSSRTDFLTTDLHVFGDASELGFGSVAYLRRDYGDSVEIAFLCAKSRVAPLKYVTIPRLELCASVMSVRLANLVTSELRIPIDSVTFWSDSTTVLSWLSSTSFRFHVYVANRLGEILESSNADQWRYVPTSDNPADDVSRGVDASELCSDHRWFTGPPFLYSPTSDWPLSPTIALPDAGDPEVREVHWVGLVSRGTDSFDRLLEKVSRITHLYRTTAYVIRWIRNRSSKGSSRFSGPLSVPEVVFSRNFWIRRAQRDAYPDEYRDLLEKRPLDVRSSLVKLSPFLDGDFLLTVGGRLDNAPLPFHARHPWILPRDCRLTRLIVWKAHHDSGHSSVDRTLQELRNQFWIPRGRSTVRNILNSCMLCRRRSPKPLQPIMANLPAFRLQPGLPVFARTGVDYFGPFEVKIFRRSVKRWGCLFTCLTSRAVHIEAAYALDTDSFLLCLSRFELRYGTPISYHSDNGTNFVGAHNLLKECLQGFDQSKIKDSLCARNVSWFFNPPAAPHFGGVWERLVRSAKRALLHVLHGQTLTDETFVTALAHVTNLLNNRPITSVGDDPDNPEPLTPHHLLLGRANPNLPPDEFTKEDLCHKRRWRFVQAMTNHFWQRWLKEFLPSLIERRKWFHNQRNLEVDDIVIVFSPQNPRGSWPLGRISKVFPGPDGVVRSALVCSKGSEFHRPAVDLCLLDISINKANPPEKTTELC